MHTKSNGINNNSRALSRQTKARTRRVFSRTQGGARGWEVDAALADANRQSKHNTPLSHYVVVTIAVAITVALDTAATTLAQLTPGSDSVACGPQQCAPLG